MNKFKTLLCALILVLFCSCNFLGVCEISNIKITKSPNYKNKLAFYEVGCGATVRNSYQLSVLNHEQDLNSETRGNILICFSNNVLPIWKDDKTIQVFYDSEVEFFNRESDVNGFKIEYIVNF